MTTTQQGDVWSIGQHKLAIGNNADTQLINAMMQDRTANLVFTSPPYLQARSYHHTITDWDALMQSAYANLPTNDQTQIITNLGMHHKHNEVCMYWLPWLEWMQQHEWRFFQLAIWDKTQGFMGDHHGRLAPAYEFLFHHNKQSRQPNKIKTKVRTGMGNTSGGGRFKDGRIKKMTTPTAHLQPTKIPDNVLRVTTQTRNNKTGHPAIMPLQLAQEIIETYTNPLETVYDPFAGSGTTILAAHNLNRIGYGVEISTEYADQALIRLQHHIGHTAYNQHGQPFTIELDFQ